MVHNSEKRLSGISIDHTQEQNNKKVKDQVGLSASLPMIMLFIAGSRYSTAVFLNH